MAFYCKVVNGMERLALIGVSGRRGGAVALEAWTERLFGILEKDLPVGVLEMVSVQTCNRSELILALEAGTNLEQVRQQLVGVEARGYAFLGDAALEHLCRVAASLDSLNPGEDQIMNQVRVAFDTARKLGRVGSITSFAFNIALRAAKRVRREVPLAPANTSLFSLARPELEKLPPGARVAILGAGEMAALVARSLADCEFEVIVVNRHFERAQHLAVSIDARAMSLPAFLGGKEQVSAVVCATPAEHIINKDFLETQLDLRILIDLGLPHNVDAVEARAKKIQLIDLAQLQKLGDVRREKMRTHLVSAEMIIAQELETALGEFAERTLGSAISQLRDVYRQTIERTVGNLLSEEDVTRLAHRFAHIPVKGLRGLARQHGLEMAYSFLDEAGLTRDSGFEHLETPEERVMVGV
jgi:glutamyl-tRNA reductase